MELRESQQLVQTVRFDRDHTVVTLTREGRDLLESRRLYEDSPDRQAFHHGVQKPRELKHDAHLYCAYAEEAERLRDQGANIHRIVLENDLKREYQEFLQERYRDRDDSDGRPDRDPLEITMRGLRSIRGIPSTKRAKPPLIVLIVPR